MAIVNADSSYFSFDSFTAYVDVAWSEGFQSTFIK